MTLRLVEKPIKTGECTFVVFIMYFKNTFITPTLFPFELILYLFCAFAPSNIANISDVGIRKPSKMSTKHFSFLKASDCSLGGLHVIVEEIHPLMTILFFLHQYMVSRRLGDRNVIKFM